MPSGLPSLPLACPALVWTSLSQFSQNPSLLNISSPSMIRFFRFHNSPGDVWSPCLHLVRILFGWSCQKPLLIPDVSSQEFPFTDPHSTPLAIHSHFSFSYSVLSLISLLYCKIPLEYCSPYSSSEVPSNKICLTVLTSGMSHIASLTHSSLS